MQLKVLNLALLPLTSCSQLGCAHSARFFTSKAVTLSMSVSCVILLHLSWRWRLGRENFIESCVIWLMTQPLQLCFVLYDLTVFSVCVCVCVCVVLSLWRNKVYIFHFRFAFMMYLIVPQLINLINYGWCNVRYLTPRKRRPILLAP